MNVHTTLTITVRGKVCTLEIGDDGELRFTAPWLQHPIMGDLTMVFSDEDRVRALPDWEEEINPNDDKVLTQCLTKHLRAEA